MAWFVSERQTPTVHGKLIKPSENQPDLKFKEKCLLAPVNDWSLFAWLKLWTNRRMLWKSCEG